MECKLNCTRKNFHAEKGDIQGLLRGAMPKRARELPFDDVGWQSPCLEPFGIVTTKGYADLVRRARTLAGRACRVETAASKLPTSMRSRTAPGKFVKDPADRLVDVEVDPVTHWEKATSSSTEPPSWRDLYALPPDVQHAVEELLGIPDVSSWRKQRISSLRSLAKDAASLGGNQRRGRLGLDASLKSAANPPLSVRRLHERVNIAFIAVMIDALEYPDTLLPWLLATGMPVVGDLSTGVSHVYRPLPQSEPSERFCERWEDFEKSHLAWLDRNEQRMLDQVRRARAKAASGGPQASDDLSLLRRVHRSTQVEVHKGLMGPAMGREDLLARYQHEDGSLSARVIPRFGVEQGSTAKRCPRCDMAVAACAQCTGHAMPKLRCCDDARSSGTNDHTRMGEAVFYPSFEFPARVGAAVFDCCQRLGCAVPELLFGLDDLFAAYRRVPSSQPRFTVVALYDFQREAVVYHDVFGMNFGLKSAPVQFCRVPQFIVCLARCLLAVPVDHYVDDYLIVDIAGAGLRAPEGSESVWWPSSGQWALDQLHGLVGFGLEPKKRKHGASCNEGLGVVCDLSAFHSHHEVSFSPTSRRVSEVLAALRSAQRRRRLSPHEAQVLLGRLSWMFSSSYAASGRAATLPLVSRASRRDQAMDLHGSGDAWTSSLSAMVRFFHAYFAALPPLRFRFPVADRRTVVVYTDASFSHGSGGLGIVVFDSSTGHSWWCALRVPSWLCACLEDRVTQIHHFELLAVLCAVTTFGDTLMRDRNVLFFCDSTTAMSAAVHGTARSADMCALTHALHLEFARLQCRPWFEWVPSEANPADIPSRQEGHQPLYDDLQARRWKGGMRLPSRAMLRSDTLDWMCPSRG